MAIEDVSVEQDEELRDIKKNINRLLKTIYKTGVKKEEAEKSFDKLKSTLEELKTSPSSGGLGKYRELRAVRKSQKELYPNYKGGITEIPDQYLPERGTYSNATRQIKIGRPEKWWSEGGEIENYVNKQMANTKRHEIWHDVINAGQSTGSEITSPMEKIAWKTEDKGLFSPVKNAIAEVAGEMQARSVGEKSALKGIISTIQNASGYADKDLITNAMYKTLSLAKTPADIIEKTIKSEIPEKMGNITKGVTSGLARGLAEAPAYEFLNPPSAGPSDQEDPVYQFERGLITQQELINKLTR